MIKNLLTTCVLTICIFTMQNVNAQSEQFKFKHLDMDDGLSHPEIRAIYKDSRGFVWIGTAFGLNRFDGYGVKPFLSDPRDSMSLSDNSIENIFETPDGQLAVLTQSGLVLFHYDTEKFQRRLTDFCSRY